jgi:hypothetical protein
MDLVNDIESDSEVEDGDTDEPEIVESSPPPTACRPLQSVELDDASDEELDPEHLSDI